jgi:GDP-mannose 6-dehydrogenase
MNISIFGLGYVGTVSLGCLARDGHHVIGVDVDQVKLEILRQRRTPIIEEGMQELISGAVASGRVEVTDDAVYGVCHSDMSLVCVGTPALPNGNQDLSNLLRVSEDLGAALRSKQGHHLIVIRSTVFPGTIDGTIRPIIEKHSGKQAGCDFDLCVQPEFLREGSSIKDYDNPPYTVVGTDSERAAAMLRAVFGHLPCEFIVTAQRTAEALKYCNNIFHALKITYANEIARVTQAVGVDSRAVLDLVCRDTRLNISPAYMKPGFAFGGSCLPKDLKAVLYAAKSRDVTVPMLSGIMPSNRIHLDHAIDTVLRDGRRAVGMVGLSFKSGTDDLRDSPLVAMAEQFIGKGLDLSIYDPEVNLSRLVGANRRFIEGSIPHISSLMTDSCAKLLQRSEIVVVGLNDRDVLDALYAGTHDGQLILDLVNISEPERVRGRYQGVCW